MEDLNESTLSKQFHIPPMFGYEPAALSSLIVSYRDWLMSTFEILGDLYPSFSQKGLELLIRTCFSASLMAEEGRYPTFQVSIISHDVKPFMRFDKPIPVSAQSLRKIAPAVRAENAILVSESDGDLLFEGIISNSWKENVTGPRLQRLKGKPKRSMCIRVDAPGSLTIAFGSVCCRVRANEVAVVLSSGWESQYIDWLNELTAWIGSSLNAPESNGYYEAQLKGVVFDGRIECVWQRILELAQNLKHGGAFVISPTDHHAGIKLSFLTNGLHLGQELLGCFNSVTDEESPMDFELSQTLLDHVEQIAHLSAVDGCVVLNRNLQVLGFGGHIQVDDGLINDRNVSFASESAEQESKLMHGKGLRHASALRLCKAYAGYLIFVISQDGSITLFSSSEASISVTSFPDFPVFMHHW